MKNRKYEIVSVPALAKLIDAAKDVTSYISTDNEEGRLHVREFYKALSAFNETREEDWWK